MPWAATYLLSLVMAIWMAALLVGAVLLVIAAFVIRSSRSKLKMIRKKRFVVWRTCPIAETSDQIERHIQRTRKDLNDNITELRRKVKSTVDWPT